MSVVPLLTRAKGRIKEGTMEAKPRSGFFWILTIIGAINVMLVVGHALRHRDPWVELPLFSILVAVVMIWISFVRLDNGLARVREQIGEKAGLRLQARAYLLGFMANLAISSALPFVH
jgi:hypothetical protein